MQYDGFQLSVVLFKLAMKSGKSAVAILNEIFDTNITPDTTITVDHTPMTIGSAIGYEYRRSLVREKTAVNLKHLRK